MKVVAIDIETTGVDIQNDQIVEFGAVLFDTTAPEFEPLYFHRSIFNSRITGAPFAINMNIDKIMFAENANNALHKLKRCTDTGVVELQDQIESVLAFKHTLAEEFAYWLKSVNAYEDGAKSINICGKNAAGFDIPFCKNYFDNFDKLIRYKRRVLDPAILFLIPEDKCLPNLQTCIDRSGMSSGMVSHCAVDDAVDTAATLYIALNRSVDPYLVGKAVELLKKDLHLHLEELRDRL